MLKQQLTDLILDTLINDDFLRISSQATFSGPIIDSILAAEETIMKARNVMADVTLKTLGLNYQAWHEHDKAIEVGINYYTQKSFLNFFTSKGVEIFKLYLEMQARKHNGIIGSAAWSAFRKNAENKAYVDANLALFNIGYMEVKYLSASTSSPSASSPNASFGKELRDLMTEHYAEKKTQNKELRAKWLEEFKRNCLSLAKNGARCMWHSVPSYANAEFMKSIGSDLGLECKEENGGFNYSWYNKEAYEQLQSGVLFSK